MLAGGNADAEGQFARLKGAEAEAGLDGFLQDQLRRLGGDLFDVHAAGRGRHEDGLALHAVEHDAEVEFALDGQGFFDQQALHDAAFGTGLVGDQRHAQDLARQFAASAASLATLTPPPLPRPPA